MFPIVLTVLTRPAMYNGIRHFVFVAPALAVLGGLAGASIAVRLGRISPPAVAAAALAVLAGLVLPIREMARLHPYEYTHFNIIAGGVRGADDRYMLDYWGLAVKRRPATCVPASTRWRRFRPIISIGASVYAVRSGT